ncbi:MAG: hypothetical protein JW849_05420 [Phycisphaerae bacterium]|nr:hypothetical protein [Phycisphaerae bacterium]
MHAYRKHLVLFLAMLLPGCASPTATVDLIGVAKKSLAATATTQQQSHERLVGQYQAQQAALDAAFDADVRLAAAGQLKNARGEPVELSADWIVSARKGYAVARDLLAEQIRKETETHAVEQDNIAAAVEALQMAEELTVLQWNVSERFKQQFLKLTQQKEADNGK